MMRYQALDQYGIGVRHKHDWINNYSLGENSILTFRNAYDFAEYRRIDLDAGYAISSLLKEGVVLYNFRNKGYLFYGIDTGCLESSESQMLPQFAWSDVLNLYLDRDKKEYVVKFKNTECLRFKYDYPVVSSWINSGILLYQNNVKERNWAKRLDPRSAQEQWRIDFPWNISRLETYEDHIIIGYHAFEKIRTDRGYEGERDWHHPDAYTMVLNGETGQELWRHEMAYSKVDRQYEVVLCGGEIIREVDLFTGEIVTETQVRPNSSFGCIPHFVDKQGIYYLTQNHSFGKINRATGEVFWEFDLVDPQGERRMLSDWILLGNGNLVLQAMPNHPNGDLACVFNPEENLEYSNVKDGKRIPKDYA